VSRFSSSAVVLRKWPFSESSLALRVLTPVQGTVSLLAKGVHKPKSGSLGVLDTWALVDLQFGGPPGAEMLTLYKAGLIDRLPGLASSPERLAAAGLLAEIAELAAPPGAPSEEVFAWFEGILRELAGDADPLTVLLGGILEGLALLGLSPILEKEDEEEARWFSPAAGGLLHSGASRPKEGAKKAGQAELAILRNPREPAVLAKQIAVLSMLGDFLGYHLERIPRAWPLVQKRFHP